MVLLGATAQAAPAIADVLVLRSGDTRTGELRSCVGEVCVLGKEQVPRPQIAWIGLGDATAARPESPPARRDRVWLRDGGVVPGELVGVSLGAVAFAAQEWSRKQVAWIQLADPDAKDDLEMVAADLPPTGGASDLVVMRDGRRLRGELRGCAGLSCWLRDAPPLERPGIAAIRFAAMGDAAGPVAAGDDSVELLDGRLVPGRVHGITPAEVVASAAPGRERRSPA